MSNVIDIYSYLDYRKYIKDWISLSKSQGRLNSTHLSRRIGIHTSFLSHVLSGVKNFSFEQAADLSNALEHTELEREYFFALLQVERAGTERLKEYWSQKLDSILKERTQVQSRVGSHIKVAPQDRAAFYSSWMYLAVFVSTAIGVGQTLDQIVARFQITRERAEEILNFLTRLGLCKKDDHFYKPGETVIFLEKESPHILNHHMNWRMQGMRAMEDKSPHNLFFTSPMSISSEDFIILKKLFLKSIQKALETCRESTPKDVVCLSVDFFKCG